MVIVGDEPFILQSEIAKSCVTGPSTNGRSSAFGALCLGSNPSGPAIPSVASRQSSADAVGGSEVIRNSKLSVKTSNQHVHHFDAGRRTGGYQRRPAELDTGTL